jgi:hypothetical protein
MAELTNSELIYNIMQVLAGPPGADDDVFSGVGDELFIWRNADGTVRLMANLNDTFGYACADAEPITAENLHLFQQSVADVVRLDEYEHYGLLFAVRVRRRLPLAAVYEARSPALRELMDAAAQPPPEGERHG